jgi:probable HAF family extracellular repeat protein
VPSTNSATLPSANQGSQDRRTLAPRKMNSSRTWFEGSRTCCQLPTLPGGGFAQASAELPGDVVAVGTSGSAQHAVKWSLTTSGYPITDLGTLPGDDAAAAYSVNSTGQIVGFSGNNNGLVSHAFLFENGSMKDLNNLVDGLPSGWSLTYASGINDYGQICGEGTTPEGPPHAFALSPTRPNILIGTLNGSPYERPIS